VGRQGEGREGDLFIFVEDLGEDCQEQGSSARVSNRDKKYSYEKTRQRDKSYIDMRGRREEKRETRKRKVEREGKGEGKKETGSGKKEG
jgi:hypothetical protein